MTHYALTMPDGSVAIMQTVDGADVAECIEKFSALHDRPVAVRPIDHADIPADRTFRNAWRDDGATVKPDMPAARDIHMDRIRRVRDAELKRLDIDFMRAVEAGDQAGQRAIATEKQRLRDLPDTFDLNACATPEELKARWPDILPPPR